jgi:hypothetical protein
MVLIKAVDYVLCQWKYLSRIDKMYRNISLDFKNKRPKLLIYCRNKKIVENSWR